MLEPGTIGWYKMHRSLAGLQRSSEGQKRVYTSGQYSVLKLSMYLAQKGRPSPLKGKPSGKKGIPTKPCSEKTKRKIGLANSGPNPKKGPKTPEQYARKVELCKMMVENRKGKPSPKIGTTMSEESKIKMSSSAKIRIQRDGNPMQGKRHSPESIAKMKNSHNNRPKKPYPEEPVFYELKDSTGKIFVTKSLIQFCKDHNLDSREIRRISKPENSHRIHRGWSSKKMAC